MQTFQLNISKIKNPYEEDENDVLDVWVNYNIKIGSDVVLDFDWNLVPLVEWLISNYPSVLKCPSHMSYKNVSIAENIKLLQNSINDKTETADVELIHDEIYKLISENSMKPAFKGTSVPIIFICTCPTKEISVLYDNNIKEYSINSLNFINKLINISISLIKSIIAQKTTLQHKKILSDYLKSLIRLH